MTVLLDRIFIFGLLCASVWDGFTTVYGTARILGDSTASVIASSVFGLLVLVFMLNSKTIVGGGDELSGCIGKVLWFTAIAYDLYTSWVGNTRFIIQDATTPERTAVLIGITILVTGSPVLLSFRLGSKSA